MLASLKQGPAIDAPPAGARLAQCRHVALGNGNAARLVLRQDDSLNAALEAYRGLRTRLMHAQSKSGLRSIVITSSLPGEGKTLTTMNLGLCYAQLPQDRKSTRLNSSHLVISYAVFCLKKKQRPHSDAALRHQVLEHLARAPEVERAARLVFGDADRAVLRVVQPVEHDHVSGAVEDGDG